MLKQLRKALFWLHLAVGVVAGIFILSMAISGLSIAYQRPLTAWAERGQSTVAIPAAGARLGVEALTAKVQASRPDAQLSSVSLYSDPAASALFTVGRTNDPLYVNPYTGDLVGEGSRTVRGFFRFMTGWHRWLALEGPWHAVGEGITGATSVAYFVLLLSGLCLWLPRRWSKTNLKPILFFRRGLQGKARDWNWHNVAGIWCAPVLLFVTLTGIVMAYPWANNLLYSLTGSPPPEQRREGGRPGGGGGERRGGSRPGAPSGPAAKLDLRGFDALWTQAAGKLPDWRSVSLRFPNSPQAPVTFNLDQGDGTRPDLKAQVTFNRRTGEVQRWQPYAEQSTGQKLRFWARFVHTGEAGGWFGETIAALAACGGALLVWTGLSLAWRRFFVRRSVVPESMTAEG